MVLINVFNDTNSYNKYLGKDLTTKIVGSHITTPTPTPNTQSPNSRYTV